MDIRMIAMDLDGTLLNENSVIDSYTLHVLEQAYKKGILLVAATGRAFYAVPKEVLDCPFLSYI